MAQPNNDTGSALGPAAAWTVYYPTNALAQKAWTVLVYMNGANDLGAGSQSNGYGFDVENVNQMEQVGSSSNVNIILQWQTASSSSYTVSNPAWVGTRRYYIMKNTSDSTANIKSPLISQNSTVDTGDWQCLQDFVQWGVQAYPAQHYCLIVWDHGSGWRAVTLKRGVTKKGTPLSRAAAKRGSSPTRGVSFNYATGSFIDTDELAEGINIGNLSGQKFDVLAFDCSLEQMLEVDYQIASPGSFTPSSYVPPTYIEGSEESPPGDGLNYPAFLQNLVNNSGESPLALGTDIGNQTLTEYQSNSTYASTVTQSLINVSQLSSLVSAVNNLGAALTSAQSQWGTQIAAAQKTAESYATNEESGANYWYVDYHDLVDFTNLMTNSSSTSTYVNNAGVLSACQTVQAAATNAIAYNVQNPLRPNSHGISIWIPSPYDYTLVETQQANYTNLQTNDIGPTNQLYTQLSLAQAAPNWLTFLQTGPSTYQAPDLLAGQ